MIFLSAAWALTVLWGLGALALGAGRVGAPDWRTRIIAEFVTGVVILGFLASLMVAAGVPLSILPVYVLVLALLVLVVVQRRRSGIENPPGPPTGHGSDTAKGEGEREGERAEAEARKGRHPAAGALLVVAVLLVLWILAVSTEDRLWWDGWAIWGMRAKVLFLQDRLGPGFMDPTGAYTFTHLDYPLGVPLLGWWVYEHAGSVQPALLSLTGAVWFALLVTLVWAALRGRVASWTSAIAALGMAAFWPVAYFAIGGTADVVVALALLGAVVEVERGRGSGEAAPVWRAAIFLSLGALAKNEGVALMVLAVAILGWTGWRRQRRARSLAPLAVPIVAMAPWVLLRTLHGLSTDTLAWPSAASLANRAPVLVQAIWLQLGTAEWLPVAALTLVGLLAAWSRGWPALMVAWGLVSAYLGTVCLVYLVSPQEITWLLVTSLPRVLGALVPATLVLTVLSIFARPADPTRGPSARLSVPLGVGAGSAGAESAGEGSGGAGVRPARSL